MACVKLRPGAADLTREDLKVFAVGELAHYKVPRYVRIVDHFPMTVSGKVRKVEMRREAIDLLGLQGTSETAHA
jgi:fatty-acyl-CoA synthase